jgi:hypothetical protein
MRPAGAAYEIAGIKQPYLPAGCVVDANLDRTGHFCVEIDEDGSCRRIRAELSRPPVLSLSASRPPDSCME